MSDTEELHPTRDYTLLGGRLKAGLRVLRTMTDEMSDPDPHSRYQSLCALSWVVERLVVDAEEIAEAFDKLART